MLTEKITPEMEKHQKLGQDHLNKAGEYFNIAKKEAGDNFKSHPSYKLAVHHVDQWKKHHVEFGKLANKNVLEAKRKG